MDIAGERDELSAIDANFHDSNAGREKRILEVVFFFVVVFVAISLIVPNYFLFSADDLYVSMHAETMKYLASGQATNGRYTVWAFLSIRHLIHLNYPSFIAASGALLIFSLLSLLRETASLANISNIWARLCGALLFFTYCLNLDLYQFKEVYFSYALSFGFGALAIRLAQSRAKPVARFVLSAICVGLALGAYQTFFQILIMVIAVWALARASGLQSARSDRDAFILMASSAAGAVIYFVVNRLLKLSAIGGFAYYPQRHQGVKFILGNIKQYTFTAINLMSPVGNHFSPMTNPFVTFGLALLCISAALVLSSRANGWKKAAIWIVFLGALFCAPDPANLMLEVYWPSPRSVAGIAIFFAGVAALLIEVTARARGAVTPPKPALATLLALLILTQIVNDAQLFARRSVQQELDMAVARQIVTDVERLAPATDRPIRTKIVTYWHSNGVYKKMPYGYGVSLFGTSWSAPELLTFVSGGRVVGVLGQESDCAAAKYRTVPSTFLGADGVPVVCFPSQRAPLAGSS